MSEYKFLRFITLLRSVTAYLTVALGCGRSFPEIRSLENRVFAVARPQINNCLLYHFFLFTVFRSRHIKTARLLAFLRYIKTAFSYGVIRDNVYPPNKQVGVGYAVK